MVLGEKVAIFDWERGQNSAPREGQKLCIVIVILCFCEITLSYVEISESPGWFPVMDDPEVIGEDISRKSAHLRKGQDTSVHSVNKRISGSVLVMKIGMNHYICQLWFPLPMSC